MYKTQYLPCHIIFCLLFTTNILTNHQKNATINVSKHCANSNLKNGGLFVKKKILIILFCGIMLLGITGCKNKNEEVKPAPTEENREEEPTEIYDREMMECLEEQLGGYLVGESDELIDIPLSEVKKSDQEVIGYYKGAYASEHPDNMYMIVYPKSGFYDTFELLDFEKYFFDRFPLYQTSEIPHIPSIYIHNADNDVDFRYIENKCLPKKHTEKGEFVPSETLDKINTTTKIVMHYGGTEIGTITEKGKINEILSIISHSKRYSNECIQEDGYGFEFDMYNSNNEIIDTILIWSNGEVLMPSSNMSCHYFIPSDVNIRKIIEEESSYQFYLLLDYRENTDETEQTLIYQDGKNSYYLNSKNPEKILVKFTLNNKTMTLKQALEDKYISPDKVINDYPDMLIKK